MTFIQHCRFSRTFLLLALLVLAVSNFDAPSANADTNRRSRWKGLEHETVTIDPGLRGTLYRELATLRDGIKHGARVSKRARRAAEQARVAALDYLTQNFPELKHTGSSQWGEEAAARLIGRAVVAGWTHSGFKKGISGQSATMTSPDGQTVYDIYKSPYHGGVSMTGLRLLLGPGVELKIPFMSPRTEMSVELTRKSKDGRSKTVRSYDFGQGKASQAKVVYHNNTRVVHSLKSVWKKGGPILGTRFRERANRTARARAR